MRRSAVDWDLAWQELVCVERDPQLESALEPLLLAAGAGLLDCQRFEYGLGLLLLYLGRLGGDNVSVDRTRAILDGDERSTAGQLLSLVRKKLEISPEASEILSRGLRSRNRLIHRFLIQNFGRLMEAQGRKEVASELDSLRVDVQAAEHLLRPLVGKLAAQLDGLTFEEMQALALRIFRGEEPDPWGRPTRS